MHLIRPSRSRPLAAAGDDCPLHGMQTSTLYSQLGPAGAAEMRRATHRSIINNLAESPMQRPIKRFLAERNSSFIIRATGERKRGNSFSSERRGDLNSEPSMNVSPFPFAFYLVDLLFLLLDVRSVARPGRAARRPLRHRNEMILINGVSIKQCKALMVFAGCWALLFLRGITFSYLFLCVLGIARVRRSLSPPDGTLLLGGSGGGRCSCQKSAMRAHEHVRKSSGPADEAARIQAKVLSIRAAA